LRNKFQVARACLDHQGHLDQWVPLDPRVNVVLLEEEDLKVQLECLVFLAVREVLVDLDHLVSQVHPEYQERTENQDGNTVRMTFEKFAHQCCVIASAN